ncbi:MAG: aminotransferase class V-fold PLP-dependent enzyme [Proteobacteria bacterium]|nr:aminotransferase class V-fold PLP-dependent enzyme [Pseudomonadota bacterium]
MKDNAKHRNRTAEAAIDPENFRALGHRLVDQLSDFFTALPGQPLRSSITAEQIRDLIGNDAIPQRGMDAERVLASASDLLCRHAMSTSHPRFWAYIMGAASPIAALADFLASAVSPPMTSYPTSALTVAMEAQTVRWVAELIGYSTDCSGLFLSGGSVANLVALRAALAATVGSEVRTRGLSGPALCFYASADAHSSIAAAADICGLGTDAVHPISVDRRGRMDPDDLHRQIRVDRGNGKRPFLVVATAGTTTLGAVDPLPEIARLCRQEDLWFHVDGAYGGFAAVSPEAPGELRELREADSITVDPHKWLYMPADVGCLLVRDRRVLFDTFHQGAPYYANSDEQALLGGPEVLQFRDLGPQVSRGFRALKVRLGLQLAGYEGYRRMITDDISLARRVHELAEQEPELQAMTHSLSIATFRYVPADMSDPAAARAEYLNQLNKGILHELHARGIAYPSHTSIRGTYVIRVCIVNYNTTLADVEQLPRLVVEIGREIDARQRPKPGGEAGQ